MQKNIYLIYGHAPTSNLRSNIDIADTFDFSLHKPTGKLMLNKKNMMPALDMRVPNENLEILNFTFETIVVETAVFMEWVKSLMEFRDRLEQENLHTQGTPPFDALVRAISSFRSCNKNTTREIAGDFIQYKQAVKSFDSESFLNGYEIMENVFIKARNNGGIWFKYM
jgi:hypothetical protein